MPQNDRRSTTTSGRATTGQHGQQRSQAPPPPEPKPMPVEDFGKYAPDGKPLPFRSMFVWQMQQLAKGNYTPRQRAMFTMVVCGPIAIMTGWELYRRNVLGKEQKVLGPGRRLSYKEARREEILEAGK